MPAFCRILVTTLSLTLSASADAVVTVAQAPRIEKPRPAPATPPNVLPLPPAAIDNSLVIGGDDLKAREVSTRMTVEVQINGRGPYHFVVDSGADSSVVGLRIARELQLPVGTPAILNGTTARSIVDRVIVDRLALGQSTFHDLQLPALREVDVGGDGLIGIDALLNQRLMMDFETHVIRVEDARRPDTFVRDAIVITARRSRGQLILTHVTAAGLPLDAIIDTGSEITIGNLALRDKLLRRNRGKLNTVEAIGVTGVRVQLEMARIDELRLGPVTLRDVPMAFADVPPFATFGLSKEPALMLGTDILETFRRVSLDFRARKVRFQLKRCESTGIIVSSEPEDVYARLSGNSGEACQR